MALHTFEYYISSCESDVVNPSKCYGVCPTGDHRPTTADSAYISSTSSPNATYGAFGIYNIDILATGLTNVRLVSCFLYVNNEYTTDNSDADTDFYAGFEGDTQHHYTLGYGDSSSYTSVCAFGGVYGTRLSIVSRIITVGEYNAYFCVGGAKLVAVYEDVDDYDSVGGVWYPDETQDNIGGVWHEADEKVNIGGVWY